MCARSEWKSVRDRGAREIDGSRQNGLHGKRTAASLKLSAALSDLVLVLAGDDEQAIAECVHCVQAHALLRPYRVTDTANSKQQKASSQQQTEKTNSKLELRDATK